MAICFILEKLAFNMYTMRLFLSFWTTYIQNKAEVYTSFLIKKINK